jgi:hypothetical protein
MEKLKVRIAHAGRTMNYVLAADQKRGLAVHRRVDRPEQGWCVTHAASGRRAHTGYFSTRAGAALFRIHLLRLDVSWEQLSHEQWMNDEALRRRVTAVDQLFADHKTGGSSP